MIIDIYTHNTGQDIDRVSFMSKDPIPKNLSRFAHGLEPKLIFNLLTYMAFLKFCKPTPPPPPTPIHEGPCSIRSGSLHK